MGSKPEMSLTWLLDFDDTLASAPLTWAVTHALPRMIAENGLPADPVRLNAALMHGQQLSNQNTEPQVVLDSFFARMGWPAHLKKPLLQTIYADYQPALFTDVLPFLMAIRRHGDLALVVSNNPRAPQIAEKLGLVEYVYAVYTPQLCGSCRPKPDGSLWDYIRQQHHGLDQTQVRMIGDDPWSDGAFARQCGIRCWLLDRFDRFQGVPATDGFEVVRSLAEIEHD